MIKECFDVLFHTVLCVQYTMHSLVLYTHTNNFQQIINSESNYSDLVSPFCSSQHLYGDQSILADEAAQRAEAEEALISATAATNENKTNEKAMAEKVSSVKAIVEKATTLDWIDIKVIEVKFD